MAMRCFQQLKRFYDWFIVYYFRNWNNIHTDLKVYRILSITLLIGYCIIDTIMYSSQTSDKSDFLKFLHGSRVLALEVLMIVYASGVAAFGVSVEIYPLLLFAIANCVLVAQNCGGSDEINTAIIWVFKVFFLFLAVELCHLNFRELREYNTHFNSATRAMTRQALFFSVTMLFLSSSGLASLYHAINKSLPHPCSYESKHCGIVDLYEPLFSYDDDTCLNDLTNYTTGREQLRVLRNFIILNGVSYSIFSKNFLDIGTDAKYFLLRILLVLLFIGLSTSVLVANVDPLVFINQCRLAYNIIECIIFVIILSLLIFNLCNWRQRRTRIIVEWAANPTIPDVVGVIIAMPTVSPPNKDDIPIMDPSPKILPG